MNRFVVPWATAGVLGVVAVVLAVLLLGSGDDEVGSTAESSARAACDVLDRLPDALDPDDDDAMALFSAQLGSVTSLAMLADAQDDSYGRLADAVSAMRDAYAAQFSIEVPDFTDAREDAEKLCGGVG
jgi:hypothetical protein